MYYIVKLISVFASFKYKMQTISTEINKNKFFLKVQCINLYKSCYLPLQAFEVRK